MALIINEIFHSIQGESTFAGRPCTFVRLTGCNLRCTYCDTRYAWSEGQAMALNRIVDRVAAFGCRLVEITGGEPLFQPDTVRLVETLIEKGYRVLMETNGSFDIGTLDPACVKILDIKCPDSGEAARCDLDNLDRVSPADQIKFVISSRGDYTYAKKIMRRIPARVPHGNVLFSPVLDKLSGQDLAGWILADGLEARLQLQLHKIIWPEVERGV
ncbi:MAG: radical SAM protein [Deltaproteobacteria bacterium]|nr:radical SAM protein [Deltaproteobacteria bacterium]